MHLPYIMLSYDIAGRCESEWKTKPNLIVMLTSAVMTTTVHNIV